MSRHANLLQASDACLVVVDVQERFRGAQPDFEGMLANCVRLVRSFRALDRPILLTEQYPRGLGPTVPELVEALGGSVESVEKTCFSCCGSDHFAGALEATGARQVLVCGIETHVCVNQTVHDLLQRDRTVHVALDAVASRKATDHETALRKMERAGAILTTAEAAAFELLEDAAHPKFKEVQSYFK